MGEEPPSYWVVRDLVRQLRASLLTLAHRGPKAYSETFDLVHRLDNAVFYAVITAGVSVEKDRNGHSGYTVDDQQLLPILLGQSRVVRPHHISGNRS
jgi:hypothetical protein